MWIRRNRALRVLPVGLFTTLNSMALTQLKFLVPRSLASSRTEILVFNKLLLLFHFLSNMFRSV